MIRHGSTRVRNCQPIVRSVIEFVFSLGKQMDAVSQRERGERGKVLADYFGRNLVSCSNVWPVIMQLNKTDVDLSI